MSITQDHSALSQPRFGIAPPPHPRPLERLDIPFSYSDNLPRIIAGMKSSLLISTYKTGNLIAVAERSGQIDLSFHTFDRPMGMAVRANGIAVGTRSQIWFLRSAPDIAGKLSPRGQYDAGFFARHSHSTGDIQCHETAWVGNELWIVNTLFSCLCTLHPAYHFAPKWRPSFVSALVPEDRCHLNGIAVADGRARYVTAMAETDCRQGWRDAKVGGGVLIEIDSGQVISRGLTMPHSPRMAGGQLFVLHSGLGRLEWVDAVTGRREVVCELPGYTRGLAIHGKLAFVGLSKIRASSAWGGVPIAARHESLKCGVAVVDLERGALVGQMEFTSGTDELFDVQVLSGITTPYLSGPMAEQDLAEPLWTVMPAHG
jgi:uncharacterized protein (TIGR03032 family)